MRIAGFHRGIILSDQYRLSFPKSPLIVQTAVPHVRWTTDGRSVKRYWSDKLLTPQDTMSIRPTKYFYKLNQNINNYKSNEGTIIRGPIRTEYINSW